MATCHLCGTHTGFFGTVKMDWLAFCRTCAAKWPQQRQALAMQTFCGDGEPAILFTLRKAAFIAPESPAGRVRLGGRLAFTDKGICFLAVSRTLKSGMWPLWLAPLGIGLPVIIFLERV